MKSGKIRSIILIFGDLAVFYLGLLLTLLIRYDSGQFSKWWNLHLFPFSVLFSIWLYIFATAGLYSPTTLSLKQKVNERIIQAMFFAGVFSIAIFYFWPHQAVITPKTNLLTDMAITNVILMLWRKIYETIISSSHKTRLLFLGWSKETLELSNTLRNTPHFGYEPVGAILQENAGINPPANLPTFLDHDLPKVIREKKVSFVVASLDIHSNADFVKTIYQVLPLGVTYMNFPQFYESITGKIPVSMISEVWFLENLAEREKRIFEAGKRVFDILAGTILGIAAILVLPIVALAIKLESPGPIFFRQHRVSKNGRIFELIKFRSKTHDDAWKNSGWNKAEDEKRTTLVGRILRKSYVDELPQAFNILKGEMSLIGPRPERPEFVEELKREIPHYMMRLLVRPGISGWAQISMKYDASAADALEKLQYDLYYIKNRSFGLDMSIIFKTLFAVISRPGR